MLEIVLNVAYCNLIVLWRGYLRNNVLYCSFQEHYKRPLGCWVPLIGTPLLPGHDKTLLNYFSILCYVYVHGVWLLLRIVPVRTWYDLIFVRYKISKLIYKQCLKLKHCLDISKIWEFVCETAHIAIEQVMRKQIMSLKCDPFWNCVPFQAPVAIQASAMLADRNAGQCWYLQNFECIVRHSFALYIHKKCLCWGF